MKRTLMDSEFEVCFDLRLWTSGFCNLTAHYFTNHSFSARLNVIFLHYQTPSPECLFSELFAKWPLPSFLPSFRGEITMFTSPPVFSHNFSFTGNFVQMCCCRTALLLQSGRNVDRKIRPLYFTQSTDQNPLKWQQRGHSASNAQRRCAA